METFRFLHFKVYIDAKLYFKRILVISERVKNFSFRDQILKSEDLAKQLGGFIKKLRMKSS